MPVETMQYLDSLSRQIRAAGQRVADADEVELSRLLDMRAEIEEAISFAVYGQMRAPHRNWQHVADAAGITVQGARKRWLKAVDKLRGYPPRD